MVALTDVQARNFRTSRDVFDRWADALQLNTGREDWWVRLVAALWTESQGYVLAHDGVWGGGGRINARQSAILRQSLDLPHDHEGGPDGNGIGHNGGSVGALQQIPTPVAQAADKPWAGWGTIADCMALDTSIPKFLDQLRVTDNRYYGARVTSDPIVADLLRVQQPLESEVQANYGGAIVTAAHEIAGMFPQNTEEDWFMANNWDEAKAEVQAMFDALNTRIDGLSAKLDKAPPMFQFFRDDATGKIIGASGDHSIELNAQAEWELLQIVGLGEQGFRNYDANVLAWVKHFADQGEFPPGSADEIAAFVAAHKAGDQAEAGQ